MWTLLDGGVLILLAMFIDYGDVMETKVSKSRFKAKVFELLREVERTGECLIVTDHGIPAIEVRRYHPRGVDPLERLKGSVLAFEAPTVPAVEDGWEEA
jgi:hypothetical protein